MFYLGACLGAMIGFGVAAMLNATRNKKYQLRINSLERTVHGYRQQFQYLDTDSKPAEIAAFMKNVDK